MITDEKKNIIFGYPRMENTNIQFLGKNNILYFESKDIRIVNSSVIFKGNNSCVVIGGNNTPIKINLIVYHNSSVFLGRNLWTTNAFELNAGESRNILIGDDCLISGQCYARTTDSHMIYSAKTFRRTNEGKSIYVGDHVWICKGVAILKGSRIHSGSIIGSHSVVTGKEIMSNTIWGGNPARLIKDDIFFDSMGTHDLDISRMKRFSVCDENKAQSFIFENDSSNLSFEEIDKNLCEANDAGARLDILKKILKYNNKNRFAKKL